MSMMQMLLGAGGAPAESYWWRYMSGGGYGKLTVYGNNLAVDGNGNVYAVGMQTTSATNWWTKLDKDGTTEISKTAGGNSGLSGILTDSSDNVYIVDSMAKNMTGLGGNATNFYVTKYNSSMVTQWETEAGSDPSTYGGGGNYKRFDTPFASATNGTLTYIGGYWGLGDTVGKNAGLVCLDSSGDIVDNSGTKWAHWMYPGDGSQGDTTYIYGIAIDSSGGCFYAGQSRYAGYDSAMIGYWRNADTYGDTSPNWHKNLKRDNTANTQCYFQDCAVDSSDNVIAVGRISLGGTWNCMIQKYNSSGTLQWEDTLGGGFPTRFECVAIDSDDNIYVGGWSERTEHGVSGGYTIPSSNTITKYNSSGTLHWMRVFSMDGGTESEGVKHIEVVGDAIYCGLYERTSEFPNNNAAAFILKVPTDGSLTGAYPGDDGDAADGTLIYGTGVLGSGGTEHATAAQYATAAQWPMQVQTAATWGQVTTTQPSPASYSFSDYTPSDVSGSTIE